MKKKFWVLFFSLFSSIRSKRNYDFTLARGQEKNALGKVTRSFNLSHDKINVKLLAVPFDAFSDKLSATIPLAPDVFIAGSSSTEFNAESGLILPLDSMLTGKDIKDFFPKPLKAFLTIKEDNNFGFLY